ncbi:hypothetical protein P4S64_11845 [Vibrio sp. M60_M31a]
MDMLNVKVGMTFSGGFIDFSLFGILPGVTGVENHWYYIPLVGIAYAFVYFLFSVGLSLSSTLKLRVAKAAQ